MDTITTTATKSEAPATLTKGYAICLTGTILWSTTAIFIRTLTDTYQLPALVLAFWRDLFVSAALVIVFAAVNPARLQVGRQHLKFLAFYGLVVAVFNSLWTFSVALNGAAVATVLAYSSAAFTALLGWRLLAERLGSAKIGAVTLSMVGCVLVSGAHDPSIWRVNTAGIITGLLSGVAFAAYSLMGRAASQRGLNPWTVLLYAFGFATVFLLGINIGAAQAPVGLPVDLFWLDDALVGWAILILLAIGPTIGGYGLYTVSLAYLPASVANLIATLEPALTAGLAYLLLGERFTLPQLLGSLLIISGVILLRLSEGRLGRGNLLPISPASD
jgi:drug/metabolite transporter (DMT)-like permease